MRLFLHGKRPQPARHLALLTTGIWILTSGISSAILDINANGLSDLWEKKHNSGELFAGSFNPQADPDADGWTNIEEAIAGTNPFVPNPPEGIIRPDIVHIPAVMGEENGVPVVVTPDFITITWPTLTGKLYRLLFSPDLGAQTWLPVGEPFIALGGVSEYNLDVGNSDRRFWRVAVADTDTDDDGLTNHEEHLYGTNPALPMSFSGVPDAWLAEHFPNLEGFEPDGDPDGDGLGNQMEQQLGLNPNSEDQTGPVNLGFDEEITDSPTMSFREEYPSDVYEHGSFNGWRAATGDHIEIWDEGDGKPYAELQSHFNSHGLEQEFDLLPGTRIGFLLRYKGRYEFDTANAFDLKVAGASELLIDGAPVAEAGSTRSRAFMADDEWDKYNEWHQVVVSIMVGSGGTSLKRVTLSLVPQETTRYGENGEEHITYGGFVDLLPLDMDFIKPGTENDPTPEEIAENKEDTEGEVVGINWDDDNNSEPNGGHGILVFKNDFDDVNGTEGEDDMIRIKLHKTDIVGAKARLKYDNTRVKIWLGSNRTNEVVSEVTELDIATDKIVYLEGHKLTAAETPTTIEMQVKSGAEADYTPGEQVSVHVATPVITFQGKNFDTGGDGSKNLASQLHSKSYLGKNRRDDRNNTVILKGKNQTGNTLWYSIDMVDQTLPDLSKVITSKPYIRVRKANLDREMKMAMSLEGAHVYYGGHSNFGLGPNFNEGGTTTVDDYMNISGGGITAICIKTNDPENPNPMLDEDHGGPGFALRPGDVHGNLNNYTVFGLLKFDGPNDGDLLTRKTDVDGTPYHYIRNGKWITVVNSSGDVPVLKYASCFMASCNSGRNFGQTLKDQGVLIYTRHTASAWIGKAKGNFKGDLLTEGLSWGITHYVRLLSEGKKWDQITAFFNEHQFFWADTPGPTEPQLYRTNPYPAP